MYSTLNLKLVMYQWPAQLTIPCTSNCTCTCLLGLFTPVMSQVPASTTIGGWIVWMQYLYSHLSTRSFRIGEGVTVNWRGIWEDSWWHGEHWSEAYKSDSAHTDPHAGVWRWKNSAVGITHGIYREPCRPARTGSREPRWVDALSIGTAHITRLVCENLIWMPVKFRLFGYLFVRVVISVTFFIVTGKI